MCKYRFVVFNFVLLFGIGIYLAVYSLKLNNIESSLLPAISGTLLGFSIYSSSIYYKLLKQPKHD